MLIGYVMGILYQLNRLIEDDIDTARHCKVVPPSPVYWFITSSEVRFSN